MHKKKKHTNTHQIYGTQEKSFVISDFFLLCVSQCRMLSVAHPQHPLCPGCHPHFFCTWFFLYIPTFSAPTFYAAFLEDIFFFKERKPTHTTRMSCTCKRYGVLCSFAPIVVLAVYVYVCKYMYKMFVYKYKKTSNLMHIICMYAFIQYTHTHTHTHSHYAISLSRSLSRYISVLASPGF